MEEIKQTSNYSIIKPIYDYSLLIPTRGRVSNINRFIDSAIQTSNNFKSIEILFYIDNDDLEVIEHLKKIHKLYPNIGGIVGEKLLFSNYWNELYKISRGNLLMHSGDDAVFRTKNWDINFLEEFNKYKDNILFAYGNDLLLGERVGTLGFLHRKWVELIGYFVPPYFSCDYTDTWLTDVSEMIGRRRYIPEIIIEHMHPVAGKAGWDKTHIERVMRGKRDNTQLLYNNLLNKRIEDSNKLKQYMENYEKQQHI